MSENRADYEWRSDDGSPDLETPHRRDPRDYPWGMFTSDDFVLANVGMFMWFADRSEMAAYIREAEPTIYDVTGAELDELMQAIEPSLSRLIAGEALESVRESLNGAQEHWNTQWWGTFEDLCTGQGEFESEVRIAFRELDGDGSPDPIEAGEQARLIEFLADYGF